ncbi:hypothetical protein F4604DRAFT_1622916, partial [Suillus subluteus]
MSILHAFNVSTQILGVYRFVSVCIVWRVDIHARGKHSILGRVFHCTTNGSFLFHSRGRARCYLVREFRHHKNVKAATYH